MKTPMIRTKATPLGPFLALILLSDPSHADESPATSHQLAGDCPAARSLPEAGDERTNDVTEPYGQPALGPFLSLFLSLLEKKQHSGSEVLRSSIVPASTRSAMAGDR